MRVCSRPGCPTLYDDTKSQCPTHRKEAMRNRDATRDRYTNTRGHRAFRNQVLTRDVVCVICNHTLAVIADHYPEGRDELVARGADPNNPAYGRGLCRTCDSKQTARRQPGGWNNR